MKKTRNIFVLIGRDADVEIVLHELQFKGMTTLSSVNISNKDIYDIFDNNKSVLLKNPDINVNGIKPILIGVFSDKSQITSAENYIDISKNNIIEQFLKITDRLGLDIGDHKSNSSGLKNAPTILDCAYCRYFYSTDAERKNWTVYESKNYFVLPTLGQFIKGYLLIIPKRHIMSLAETNEEEFSEFFTVLDDIKYVLNLAYNSPQLLVWENGTGHGGVGKAKDSVVHAHIHIAPSKVDFNFIKNISGFNFIKIHRSDLQLYNNHSYLLIEGDNEFWYILSNPNVYIPRQYVRQLIADEIGIKDEQWNWRLYPFVEKRCQTCKDISNALRANWNQVPKRIKDCTEKFLV